MEVFERDILWGIAILFVISVLLGFVFFLFMFSLFEIFPRVLEVGSKALSKTL